MNDRPDWVDASHRALSRDSVLGPWVRPLGPPAIRLKADPFQALSQAVVSQQLAGGAADAIYARVERAAGEVSPKALLGLDADALRATGLSRAKAETLRLIAEATLRDGLLAGLGALSDQEVAERLARLRGIGAWTAEMFLIFSLGRPDVMSPGDLGLRKGLRIVHGLGEIPPPGACDGLSRRWRPFRSAAAWYLWRIVEGRENQSW